jgi:hypothetical protein
MKIKNNICDRCTKDKLPIKMFSKENNMDPGVVPPELKDLTIVEQPRGNKFILSWLIIISEYTELFSFSQIRAF